MTSETYHDSFDRKGQKRQSRPKLLKLTEVSMPNRSRKKAKLKVKERSQSNVRDRIYDDPAYTDDISHLAIPLRRNSGPDKLDSGSSNHKKKSSHKDSSHYLKRLEPSNYRRDGSSSSDNMPPDPGKHRLGHSLERTSIVEKSPNKREKRDRSAKQKRNLSLDNTLSNSLRRSLEKTAAAENPFTTNSVERHKSRSKPMQRQNASEGWSSCLAATSDSSKATENEEMYSRKEQTKMQIGKRFLKGEIGIKSFNYYLLKEGLKSSKKFMDKQRGSLSKSDSKKYHSKSEENIYEEIFFVDKNSEESEDHSKYPDCELCIQECTKEDCEYCLADMKSKRHGGGQGRYDRGPYEHHAQEELAHSDEVQSKNAHILQYQSYNPNNPGVYKIETTPVAFTSDYNPIHHLQMEMQPHQQQQLHHQQQPQQQHQQPRRSSKAGSQVGSGIRMNAKSSSSSDSLHHKYAARERASHGSQDFYEYTHPVIYGAPQNPAPGYDQKIYKSDSKVSIISEYSVRSESSNNRNFRCGEVSDSSLGDSMFSYSTQRRYFGSSESCRFAFECRRCSYDGEKCSFSDTCRYECRNCDCSSSYFSSDFDDGNYNRKSTANNRPPSGLQQTQPRPYEYYNDTVDFKQNKYAQDFIKHVNDVKRSIYQAEVQRSSVPNVMDSYGTVPPPKQVETKKSLNQHHQPLLRPSYHEKTPRSGGGIGGSVRSPFKMSQRSLSTTYMTTPPSSVLKDVNTNHENNKVGQHNLAINLTSSDITKNSAMATSTNSLGERKTTRRGSDVKYAAIVKDQHRNEREKLASKDSLERIQRRQTGAIPKLSTPSTIIATAQPTPPRSSIKTAITTVPTGPAPPPITQKSPHSSPSSSRTQLKDTNKANTSSIPSVVEPKKPIASSNTMKNSSDQLITLTDYSKPKKSPRHDDKDISKIRAGTGPIVDASIDNDEPSNMPKDKLKHKASLQHQQKEKPNRKLLKPTTEWSDFDDEDDDVFVDAVPKPIDKDEIEPKLQASTRKRCLALPATPNTPHKDKQSAAAEDERKDATDQQQPRKEGDVSPSRPENGAATAPPQALGHDSAGDSQIGEKFESASSSPVPLSPANRQQIVDSVEPAKSSKPPSFDGEVPPSECGVDLKSDPVSLTGSDTTVGESKLDEPKVAAPAAASVAPDEATFADEISRKSDAAGATLNSQQSPRNYAQAHLDPDDTTATIETSEATSTDESKLTKASTRSSFDYSSTDKIDISDLPLPAIPPKKRRSKQLDQTTSKLKPDEDVIIRKGSTYTQRQRFLPRTRGDIEKSFDKDDLKNMHYHSSGQMPTSTSNNSAMPTYFFGENRVSGSKKLQNTDEIYLNKSGWVQVNSKRVNDENSPASHNRRTNVIRLENQNGGAHKNSIRVIQMDKNNRDKPIYAVPRLQNSKIEELISRNEARRGSVTAPTKNYMRPGYKIIDPQVASILNERPGFLPVKTFMDIESPPPITPILSPPPAFQDTKSKKKIVDNNISVKITSNSNKYDPKQNTNGKGMVFSRSFEYDNRKAPTDYAETFSKSFDCNLSDQKPIQQPTPLQHQRDRSPNFSTLTGCSPNYLSKKETKSRDNSPKYQQPGQNYLHPMSMAPEMPIYSVPRKLDKLSKGSSVDRNGRSRRAQFSSRQHPTPTVPSSRFRSFDASSSQRLNSCDSGARSDLSNDEIDNDDDEKSSQFLSATYQPQSGFKHTRQRSITPEKYESSSYQNSLRMQRSITPESRSLTPEDRRKKGSQISLSSRQNSGSRTNTLERKQKYEDKSHSPSRSSSSSSYSGRDHEVVASHRRSATRNKGPEEHRIRRSRSLQLTERSPSRMTQSHKMVVCLGQPSVANNPSAYHHPIRSFPPTIRPNQIFNDQSVANNRMTRPSDIDKSRSFDLDYGQYMPPSIPARLDFDKSRSFDENYREPSNKTRYMTDLGPMRDDRVNLKGNTMQQQQQPQQQRTPTTIPRQTSPQNYGTRLCDHELTYDMLRRTLDRSPIMDFSRDYDVPVPSSGSLRNRDKLAPGTNELNFLNERIYDHGSKKLLRDQSPLESSYSLDRMMTRDSYTPETELKSIRDSFQCDDRLRLNDYIYRQPSKGQLHPQQSLSQSHQPQRSLIDRNHQSISGSSAPTRGSCTASSCDFWPHCGLTNLKTKKSLSVDQPKKSSGAIYINHLANDDDDDDDDDDHDDDDDDDENDRDNRNDHKGYKSVIDREIVENDSARRDYGRISKYIKSQSFNESMPRSYRSSDQSNNRVKSKPPMYVNAPLSTAKVALSSSSSSSVILLGEREMPITRERDLTGSNAIIGGKRIAAEGSHQDSKQALHSSIELNVGGANVKDSKAGRSTSSRSRVVTPNRKFSRKHRSLSLPNILIQTDSSISTGNRTVWYLDELQGYEGSRDSPSSFWSSFDRTDKVFASVSSNNDDEKRDPFSPNLKDQIRAVSSPSLSENPSEIIKFSSERSAASDLVSNTGSGDSSNQNYAGVLQKFKKTFSQFKTTGKQQIPSSQQQLQQQQQQQQSKSDLGSGSVNQITDLDPARYRFGHLVWRSSKERRKTKHNRRDKCNSGDSGIQIELESEEIYHTDGLDSIEIPASAINIRVRRVNSAKAANTMTSYSSAKAKALKKIESYDNKITATPIPKRSLSQPSGLDRMTRTDFDESDTDSVSSHPDFHDGQRSIYAEVLFPFSPVGPQELALERGNLIEIIRKDSGLWWYGRIKNDAVIEKVIPPRQGWFPKDFVRIIPITFGLDPGDDDDDAADLRLSSNAPEKKINTRDLLKHCDTNRTATQLLANNTTTIGPLKGILLSPSQQQNRMQQQNSESLRMSVIRELLETEINYVKLLSSLCLGYLKEMRKRIDIFTPESLILIFSNIESIWRFQQTFLDALRKGIENDRIAQVFLNNQNGFMVYSMYCNAYPRALMELESYTSSKDAKCILENCRIAENLPELPLSAHLLAPIQRICRYPLHLAELVKHSTLSSSQAKRTASSPCLEEDANSLSSQDIRDCKETLEIALAAMKKVTEMVNEGKRHSENLNRFQTSFESFEGPPIAFHSTRFFMQTDATRVSPNLWNNTYTLFLFDHQLIYCKKDILKRNHYIYKGRIFLDDCRILNLPDGKLFGASLKNALRIYCQSRNKWFDFCFRSASRKIRFLSTLAAERQFCGTSLFVSELAGDEDDNLSDREYHSDYDTMERGVNAENVRNMNLNWKESLYDAEKLIESPSKQLKFSSDTLPKKSRKVAKDGYEYNTGSLGRRKIGNWFRKAKSTNTTPTQSPTHHSMLTFNSDSSSQSSPALGYMGNKSKVKDPIISS